MVKIGEKVDFNTLNKRGYLLGINGHVQGEHIEIYQKHNRDNKATELIFINGVCEMKYIYEVIGNQIIKTLKEYGG